MKANKRLLASLGALVVAIAMATTSTFAWFSVSKTATVENLELTVMADEGLFINGRVNYNPYVHGEKSWIEDTLSQLKLEDLTIPETGALALGLQTYTQRHSSEGLTYAAETAYYVEEYELSSNDRLDVSTKITVANDAKDLEFKPQYDLFISVNPIAKTGGGSAFWQDSDFEVSDIGVTDTKFKEFSQAKGKMEQEVNVGLSKVDKVQITKASGATVDLINAVRVGVTGTGLAIGNADDVKGTDFEKIYKFENPATDFSRFKHFYIKKASNDYEEITGVQTLQAALKVLNGLEADNNAEEEISKSYATAYDAEKPVEGDQVPNIRIKAGVAADGRAYSNKVKVYVWVEGTDADCIDALLSIKGQGQDDAGTPHKLTVKVEFTGAATADPAVTVR